MTKAILFSGLMMGGLVFAQTSSPLSAQQTGQPESFSEFGFSVKVPPGWQVSARPTASQSTFKMFKQVSPDLFDECVVEVSYNKTQTYPTQEEIDAAVRDKFYGSPVPDFNAQQAEIKRLEEAYLKGGSLVSILRLDLDTLAGHPSESYTMKEEHGGNTGEFKRFSYIHILRTPARLYSVNCHATSHDMDSATMEFGQKIYAQIVPFVASFTLVPQEVK